MREGPRQARCRLRGIERNLRNDLIRRGDGRLIAHRRMVAPRARGVKSGCKRRADLCGDLLPGQLVGPVLIEHLHHAEANEDGIDRGPRLGLVHEHAKGRGQIAAMLRNVGVDAARIVGEVALLRRTHAGGDALRGGQQQQRALQLVVRYQ